MKKRLCAYLVLSLLAMRGVWAHDAPLPVPGYTVQHFTDENGLPQNSIKAIVPDAYGFIWLATESGVVRFDGNDFRTYGKAETGLESARMLGFVKGGREGELFALTDGDELLSVYRGNVAKGGRLTKAQVDLYRRYLHDRRNDPQFGYPSYFWRPTFPGVYKVYLADPRSYYACSADRIRYYRGEWQIFDFPYRQDSLSAFFLLDGHLYLHNGHLGFKTPTSKGLHGFGLSLPADSAAGRGSTHIIWNPITGKAYLYRNLRLYELLRKPDGTLRGELLLKGFALDVHNVHAMHRDPATGTLFLGSSTEGLYVFRKHGFNTLRTGRGADYDVFYAHDYIGNNSVISTQGYVLGPGMAPRNVHLSGSGLGGWRYALLVTRRRRSGIWLVQTDRHAVLELDPAFNVRRRFPIASGNEVHVLYEGLDGSVWMGLNSGLYRLGPQDTAARFGRVAPLLASCLTQTRPGELWVGRHDGLSRLSLADSQWVNLPTFNGMTVRHIYPTGQSQVWVTTYGNGFYLIREGQVLPMPLDRRGYLNFPHCILEDRNGFFWIPSNKGLFQVAKNDLLAYAEGQAPGVYYHYYGKESGFNTNEFNGGCQPCGARWDDGSFSFPSLDGLVHFDPYRVKPEFPDGEIFFDRIELDGKPLAPADTLTLSPDFSRITFYVTTPYYGHGNNLQLQASLQKTYGENLWTTLDGDDAISFTTLRPGTYRLVIRKPKGFGVGNYSYRTVVVVVPPAFWQTGWFMALAVLLLVLGVYAVIRSRIRYVQRRNRELERIIADRTHDLRETVKALRQSKNTLARQSQLQQKMILAFSHDLKSPLMYLMITGQKLYEGLRGTPGKMLNSIQIMYHSAFNMYHFTDNFLNYAKVYFLNERPGRERFSLHGLAHEKIEIFRYIAEAKNIALRNRIPEDMHLHMNRMLLSIIFHNLLDNAIKYTDEGSIDFSVAEHGGTVTIAIADTGMGMDEQVKKQYADIFGLRLSEEYVNEGAGKGLGLQIVAELMHILGGKLHIESEPDRGTTITLQFKEYAD